MVTSQCGPRRPNLNETKIRRRYDIACWVGYWSLIKKFLSNKKILLIQPLFHENRFIIDFKEKAELFNSFITNQYSLLKNSSKLSIYLRYVTDKRLRTINFTTDNIERIIASFNPNKAHGLDNIYVCTKHVYVCTKYVATPFVNL